MNHLVCPLTSSSPQLSKRHHKRPFSLALIAMGVVAMCLANVSNAAIVFQDDGFEDDVAGAVPGAPAIGGWALNQGIPATGSFVLVNDAASPGPANGTKYLSLVRTLTATSEPLPDIRAILSSPLTSGTIHFDFDFHYQSTGTSSVGFAIRDGGSSRLNIFAEPNFAEPNYYAFNSNFTARSNTTLPVALTSWDRIGIDYTAGSADLTLTVNGASQVLAGIVTPSNHIDNLYIFTASKGTSFSIDRLTVTAPLDGDFDGDGDVDAADYVFWRKNDGTPAAYDTWRADFGQPAGSGANIGSGASIGGGSAVPEPATAALLIVGILALSSCRRRLAAP